jgi:hypothetical protein
MRSRALFRRKSQLAPDRKRNPPDALRVTCRMGVASLDRRVERLDRLEQGRLERARGFGELV